jgi:CubicO group peptidase (beta-lactamase class C family)
MEYLKRAIEHKFGIAYEHMIDSLIFSPLGMTHSQYWSDKLDRKNFAYSHDVRGEIFKSINYAKEVSGAGNIHTTAEDLSKFALYMLQGAGISPALYQQMITHQGNEKANAAFWLRMDRY